MGEERGGAKSAEGGGFLRRLGQDLIAFKDRALDAFGAIGEALRARDWALAAEIGLLALRVEFGKFHRDFMRQWQDFTDSIEVHWDKFWDSFAEGFSKGWDQVLFKLYWRWQSFLESLSDDSPEAARLMNARIVDAWREEFPGEPLPKGLADWRDPNWKPPETAQERIDRRKAEGKVEFVRGNANIFRWWEAPAWRWMMRSGPGGPLPTDADWQQLENLNKLERAKEKARAEGADARARDAADEFFRGLKLPRSWDELMAKFPAQVGKAVEQAAGDAAKGVTGTGALRGALAASDRIGEKIAANTEKTVQKLQELNQKFDRLKIPMFE